METTTELPEPDITKEQLRAQIFAKRNADRAALSAKLDACGADDLAARLDKCGQPLGMTCTACGHQKSIFTRCDLKWCPSCAPLLAHDKVTRYAPICAEFVSPLFVTLTVKNYSDRVGVRELRRAFTALRRQRWFKKCCLGGVASFEVTNTGKGWHPHIHALVDCRWLSITVNRPPPGSSNDAFRAAARRALNEVADVWSLAVGRKGSLKVRAVFKRDDGDPTAAMREVIKYSVKPSDLIEADEPDVLIRELSLSRNLVSWGSAYRHPTLRKPAAVATKCECCNAERTFLPDDVIARICRTQPTF